MSEVLLDRQGTNPHRDGYSLVTSEVELLKLAVGNNRLQVRGAICDWAQTFCEARQIAYREMLSPIAELGGLCAELDEVKSERIIDLIGNQNLTRSNAPFQPAKCLMRFIEVIFGIRNHQSGTLQNGCFGLSNFSLRNICGRCLGK